MSSALNPHLLIFSVGSRYKLAKAIKAGFKLDLDVRCGEDVEYREHRYSRYDDCHVYYFKRLDSGEVFEYWVHRDTPISETYALFTRDEH